MRGLPVQSVNKEMSRRLRREATSTEKELWRHLRNRKVAGLKFRRQQCFGPYVLDFYCAEEKLNIEIDGGQHDLPERREHDARRTALLEAEGIRTLRFWNSEIRENLPGVLYRIKKELGLDDVPSP